jgi:hypothetical protein
MILAISACGHGNQPSDPINLSGSWSGTASDSSGPGAIAWQLTQSGSSFSGTLTMTDTSSGARGRGSVSGTLSGTTVEFAISIPAGGFDEPWAVCTADLIGTAKATASAMSGEYAGSNSCTGSVTSGQLTLDKS